MAGVAGVTELRHCLASCRTVRRRRECRDRIAQIARVLREHAVVRVRGEQRGLDGAGNDAQALGDGARLRGRALRRVHEIARLAEIVLHDIHQRARIRVALAEDVRDRDGDERAEEGAADHNAREVGPLVLAVAAELRAEQGRQNLGLRELAVKAGVPHSTLSKSLNGLRMIDVEELAKVCRALEVEPAVIWARAAAALAPVGGLSDDALLDVVSETRSRRGSQRDYGKAALKRDQGNTEDGNDAPTAHE